MTVFWLIRMDLSDVYEINHMNCGNEIKWRLILAVMNVIKCNCIKKPEKNSGLQRGLNPWPRDTGATLYQLSYEATDIRMDLLVTSTKFVSRLLHIHRTSKLNADYEFWLGIVHVKGSRNWYYCTLFMSRFTRRWATQRYIIELRQKSIY